MTSLDLDAVHQRATAAAQAWRPGVVLGELVPLQGGSSSITYTTTVDGSERIVLKLAPPGLEPVRNRDVLRQARLLRAIHGQPGVAVPEVLFESPGDPPMFAMSFISGDSFEPVNDVGDDLPPEIVASRARSAARMLAALHSIDPSAVGLGDEPERTISDELDYWTRLLDRAEDEFKPGWEALRDGLYASIPASVAPVITHGDYRLGNTLAQGGEVVAIIDWEIWWRGDPRMDVAWLRMFTDPAFQPGMGRPAPGMPSDAELTATYEAARSCVLPDVPWFDALARYKQAAAIALIVKLNRRQPRPDPWRERGAVAPPLLIEQGLELLTKVG